MVKPHVVNGMRDERLHLRELARQVGKQGYTVKVSVTPVARLGGKGRMEKAECRMQNSKVVVRMGGLPLGLSRISL